MGPEFQRDGLVAFFEVEACIRHIERRINSGGLYPGNAIRVPNALPNDNRGNGDKQQGSSNCIILQNDYSLWFTPRDPRSNTQASKPFACFGCQAMLDATGYWVFQIWDSISDSQSWPPVWNNTVFGSSESFFYCIFLGLLERRDNKFVST